MLVSTKGRYALRVMIDLAENQTSGYIPLKEIAQRQDVSENYLESILKTLVRAGVLAGQRGKGGGYRLTQDPSDYTVSTILHLTEEAWHPWPGWTGRATIRIVAPPFRCGTISTRSSRNSSRRRTIADLASSSSPGDNYVI